MIIDALAHARFYRPLSPRIAAAFDYLAATDLNKLDDGRYTLDGDNLFVLLQRYETKPPETGKWEAHRRYIDLQYIVGGQERMGYAPLETLKVTDPYNEKDDYLLLEGAGNFLTVPAGCFLLFAPQDAHMPGLAVTTPQPTVKAVVKIKI